MRNAHVRAQCAARVGFELAKVDLETECHRLPRTAGTQRGIMQGLDDVV